MLEHMPRRWRALTISCEEQRDTYLCTKVRADARTACVNKISRYRFLGKMVKLVQVIYIFGKFSTLSTYGKYQ